MKKEITIIIPAGYETKIEAIKNINPNYVNIIIERGKNPSKNRNKGIKKAKTPFIAFINAHTLLDKSWFKEVLAFFKKYPEVDVVGGPQFTPKDSGIFEKASGYALSCKFGSAKISNRYAGKKENLNADETTLTSANIICRKKIFKKIKFDETLYPGEDPKFIEDIKKEDFKVAYSPKIIVYNKRRKNIFSFIKQIYLYGLMRPKKESLSKTVKNPFFLIPSIFLIYLISLPLVLIWSNLFLLPLFVYICINIIFSFYESLKNRNILCFFILPLLFLIIHVSYGVGFLKGLFSSLYK